MRHIHYINKKRYQNATKFVLFYFLDHNNSYMSRVDWVQAEVKYVTKQEVSYDWLAQLFGVAKTTIVRHAVKEEWPKKRKDYIEKRISVLEERTMQKRIDVDERHLRNLRTTQAVFNNEIVRLGLKQQRGENIATKEWNAIARLTSAMVKAIMAERDLLGLPTKLIRVTDPAEIERIQRAKGIKEDPPYQKYRETKAILEGIDIEAILKYKKILEKYVKKVEETGDYNIEHPLW